MTYVFDIDGTICTLVDGDYKKAKPIVDRVNEINNLYNNGNKIIFLTARGMGRFDGDSEKAYDKFFDLTKRQLDTWGVKYHKLFLGKPAGDIYVDDKGVSDKEFFEKNEY